MQSSRLSPRHREGIRNPGDVAPSYVLTSGFQCAFKFENHHPNNDEIISVVRCLSNFRVDTTPVGVAGSEAVRLGPRLCLYTKSQVLMHWSQDHTEQGDCR